MKRTLLLAAFAGASLAPAVLAQAPAPAPGGKADLAQAETIAKNVCAATA